jgi:acetolactate synthase I/II/III large subunit
MTIAEHLADRLSEIGVRYVFGIPGGPSIPLMEAFRNAGIEFILTSNESAAAIMADVTARLTKIPGVCHATFGPGATNISTGVGGAFLDRSPVIVLTSEMSDSMIARTTQMNINHQHLFKPITKATFRLSEENCCDAISSAIEICREGYPGPVHIGIPANISEKELKATKHSLPDTEYHELHGNPQKVISLLDRSQKPVLALGLTASRMVSRQQILTFLDEYPMPVVITPMAKGLIPESHPCFAGVLFHSLSDYLEDIYCNCDLVIGLGYDPVEFNYEAWMPDVPLAHFDTRETDMPSDINSAQFIGPPEKWFQVLRNINKGWLVTEHNKISEVRNEMLAVFNGFTGHFGPSAVLKILQEELPADSIVTADVGSHLHLAGQFWNTGTRGKLIMTNGWSGMGFGLPAALAARLADGDRIVVCITGDGGFLMNAGEIVTARRYNLPVITVVFSDGELNLIKVKQSWRNLSPYSTILYQGDLFGSYTFLGCRVITVSDHGEMRRALSKAISENQPVIINAIIDPEEYKWLIVRR